jgi:Cdc6-like AAA superfamily ATPase
MNGEEAGILVNAEVLDEDYLPEVVHARKPQIRELKFCFDPIFERRKPIDSWLYREIPISRGELN